MRREPTISQLTETATPPEKDRDAFDSEAFESFDSFNTYRVAWPEFEIVYQDREGAFTTRRIAVHDVWETDRGEMMLRAHCYLRSARRYFGCGRIHSLIDQETGEIWTAEDVARNLRERLEQDPSYRIKRFLESSDGSDIASALLYVARADGRMIRKEREVIGAYIAKKAGLMDSADGTRIAGEYLDGIEVTLTKLRRSKSRLKSRGCFQEVVEVANAVAGTRKSGSVHLSTALAELGR